MRIEDFVNYFDTIYACHYLNGNTLSSLPCINDSQRLACFQFNISQKGDFYFGVSQEDLRALPSGHEYGILSIAIGKINGDKVKFIGAKGGDKSRDIWCLSKCMPGSYLAFVTTHWSKNNFGDERIGFWVYGPEALDLERVTDVEHVKKCYDIMKLLFIDYVIFHNFYSLGFKA